MFGAVRHFFKGETKTLAALKQIVRLELGNLLAPQADGGASFIHRLYASKTTNEVRSIKIRDALFKRIGRHFDEHTGYTLRLSVHPLPSQVTVMAIFTVGDTLFDWITDAAHLDFAPEPVERPAGTRPVPAGAKRPPAVQKTESRQGAQARAPIAPKR